MHWKGVTENMRGILFKLLLFTDSILLIMYMGLATNTPPGIKDTVPIFLSSLMLIDATYTSSCNIRENKIISLFCGLLALDGWYILLSVSDNAITYKAFSALSPVIWYVSINFMLMFLFQGSGYRFQKPVNICLAGTCICALAGILLPDRVFALAYGIQFLASWLCFIFVIIYHKKRIIFVFKAEWKSILFSLVATSILFLVYYFSTMGVKENLSNFGIYLPVLLLSMSIHSIILKEHNSFPLSTIFSRCQLIWILLSGAVTCGLITIALGIGWLPLFLMLDAMSSFVYACNIALDFNLKQGKNNAVRESRYHAALAQLQREEQLNLGFANFLHDDILQDLLSVKNMMHKADRPDVQKMITETLDDMNTYIREQMQDYHPVLLPKLTVKENYQNLLAYISQSFPQRNIHIVFDCPDSLFLVAPYDIFVYRILRELATNIYKHSAGDRAWITLAQVNGTITLCVKDNGTADADTLLSADPSRHRGLALIADRVSLMDGTVKITNGLPHGICIQITLPMKGDVSYQHFISR